MPKKILGVVMGNCVHVAGIMTFLRLAEDVGYDTHFLGPATPIPDIISASLELHPDVLAVSYRLTPAVAESLFAELKGTLHDAGLSSVDLICGGTPPVAEVASKTGMFSRIFSGEEGPAEVLEYLRGQSSQQEASIPPQKLMERIVSRQPYPLIRHHFGLPDVSKTIEGVRKISAAKVLDVLSLGPDQNAQFSFFRPSEMDSLQHGAGGVPVRTREDLAGIYEASRCGNYPLMRCYSGTRDLLLWAEMNKEVINNAWAAVPLCWYNALDGRSDRPPAESILENLKVMAWHAERGIPVEVNESHHWSLREAPDTVAVVAAYLAALNAKKQGVETYVAQFMFNTPMGTSYVADLAKMTAKRDLIESLHDASFASVRQVRTGLMSLSANMFMAKGQLASSIALAMNLEPHIVHVVGYSEANFAATPEVVIESCQMIHGVIRNQLYDAPNATLDSRVVARRDVLLSEAKLLLSAIESLGQGVEALTDPNVIAKAIEIGLLDAPHLKGSRFARGEVRTQMINGACIAVNEKGCSLTEKERIERVFGR
ncbi:MAG: methionine synthase I cobalamin-binding subunit [Bacillota bacterium]|nr:MAG: methionine synthase I cobalamin-binding subunit [Bacillota bacterium]